MRAEAVSDAGIVSRMITALTVLLCCQLVGEVASRLFGLPVPGPVVGMMLLFVALLTRARAAEQVHEPAHVLIRYLSLLFVPAGVGLIRQTARLRAEILPIVVAVIVSTAATIAVTAIVFQAVARARGER